MIIGLLAGVSVGVRRREVRVLDATVADEEDNSTVAAASRCYDLTWVGEQVKYICAGTSVSEYIPYCTVRPSGTRGIYSHIIWY